MPVPAAALVLLWCIRFRGGLLALGSPTSKGLILNVHPVLMPIGFIILGSESIMSHKILPWGRDSDKMAHLLLHAVTPFLGSVGIYAAFKFHSESGIANLYRLHSWVGLGTICLYGIQGYLKADCFNLMFGCSSGYLALPPSSSRVLHQHFDEPCSHGTSALKPCWFFTNLVVVILLGSTLVMYVTAPMHSEHMHGYSAVHKS
ncbi:hypothetical protein ABZP36_010944 [Zizania latifolia]